MTTVYLLPYITAQITPTTHLAYLDSWHARADPLPTSYTTLLALHGVGFNSAVWTPLLSSIPDSIRFIAFNQRSYAGSSPAFQSTLPGGTDATEAYRQDLLDFLAFAGRELALPAVESSSGGITLLGWSKGTVLPLSLLSTLPSSPLLESHLRSIILFEPPGSALGRAPTSDYTSAMAAVSPPHSSTPTAFAEAFAGWIGGYSEGDGPASGLEALEEGLRKEAWQPERVAHGFSWRMAPTAEEVRAKAFVALSRSAKGEGRVGRIGVGLVYGGRTNGYCMDAARTIEGIWSEVGERRTAVRRVEGTNHFAFVHRPNEFMEAVVEILEELGA